MKHNCETCEYRHGGCIYDDDIDNIPEDNCEYWTEGKCFSCELDDSEDGECISHQMAFNYVGCKKYIPKG